MSVAADFSGRDGFFASFGGEHQYISQEFYNAVLDTTTMDVIETWQLTSDKINDFIFKTNLGYNHQDYRSKSRIMGDMELSGDRFLARSEGFYQLGGYDNRLKLFGKFESRSPMGDNDNRTEAYRYFQTHLSGQKRLSHRISVDFKTGFEHVSFDKNAAVADSSDSLLSWPVFYSYDYSLLSTRLGGVFTLSEFTSELAWRAGYNHREVPDSGAADYDQYRGAIEYNYSSLGGVLSLEGELEFRNYMQPEKADDFLALIFRGRGTKTLADRVELETSLQTDWYRYRQPDFVNRDYLLVRGEIGELTRLDGWGLGPLFRLESRREKALSENEIASVSESFDQWEAGLKTEFFNLATLFFDGEVTYGSRDYRETGGYLTSYDFWSISLIGNYAISRNLSFNLMFDGLFEKHQIREDDANIYLLSLGVNARIH